MKKATGTDEEEPRVWERRKITWRAGMAQVSDERWVGEGGSGRSGRMKELRGKVTKEQQRGENERRDEIWRTGRTGVSEEG